MDETNERIGEKVVLLSGDEVGKDLAGVEQLLRGQNAVERDMSAIHRKLNEHDERAKQLLEEEGLPLRETVGDNWVFGTDQFDQKGEPEIYTLITSSSDH